MDLQLDYIALVLILLQLILLVRIARALEGLNPAKIAEAIKASQSEKQENEIAAKQRSKVCLDELRSGNPSAFSEVSLSPFLFAKGN